MFLEVYSGGGNLSRHVRKLGKATVSIDIRHGDWCDIGHADVFKMLKGWLQSGMVWGLWLGTPCNGLTQARRGPPGSRMPDRLRDRAHLRGLAGLAPKDVEALRISNMTTDRGGALQRIALARGLPVGVENPPGSFLWQFPSRQRAAAHPCTETRAVDYCSCSTPFRARTKLLLWHHRPSPALDAMHCTGRGTCSFTRQPHLQLSGATSAGFRTAAKNHYPDILCRRLASAMVSSFAEKKASRLWNLMR